MREGTTDRLRIDPDVKLGPDVELHGFVNLYGCEIGAKTKIGCFVEIQKGATVGKRCKISGHTFICEGVTLEDDVFIGHGVMFTNDLWPRAVNPDGTAKQDGDWSLQTTCVKRGASIGTGATILAGVTIGENAMIGAGSLITKDVPPNVTVAGNPARIIRSINEPRQ
jgi:UDP-2-acetamido-3-amino-2,3-dideoxy-glucuronate N-acetyltransferase